ncbi:MAG: hypothetical protein HUJ75_06020, partial [Parasporobacterium sp.]|nr:hypothetical protein [Parasporobacterium sp.]
MAEPVSDTETADGRAITVNSAEFIPVNKKPYGLKASFLKHPWLWAAGLMLLFWLPWIIAFYPGSITYDMVYQLAQFDGALKLNAHHPPFATWVMGGMVSLGRLIMGGDTGLGLFLYIIVQTVACAASFAYSIKVLVRRGTGLKFIVVTLAFFCLTPLWGSLMQLGSKDLVFTALFVWFMTLSSEILLGNAGAKKLIFWALSLIGCCLYRNGIIIVMVPTVAVMWVSVLKNHMGRGRAAEQKHCAENPDCRVNDAQGNAAECAGAERKVYGQARIDSEKYNSMPDEGRVLSGKKLLKSFTAAALAALAVAVIFGSVMTSVLKLKTETGEALSIPFQQTARFMRDFPEDLSEEDIEILEKTFMVK